MRKQLITVAGSLAAILFAFIAGTAIASHFSSHNSPRNSKNNNPSPGGFSFGGPPGRYHGVGGFFGASSGNIAIGRVTKISGDTITVSSIRPGADSIVVSGSTTYSKRTSSTSGSSSASLSDVRMGSFVLARGSRNNGQFVAKTISIMPGFRPGALGGFRPGQGHGFHFGPGQGFTPPTNSQPPLPGSGT